MPFSCITVNYTQNKKNKINDHLFNKNKIHLSSCISLSFSYKREKKKKNNNININIFLEKKNERFSYIHENKNISLKEFFR